MQKLAYPRLTMKSLMQTNVAFSNDDVDPKMKELITKIESLKHEYDAKLANINKYNELTTAALEQQKNKNYKKAVELCSSAIKLAPDKSSAYYIRSEVYKTLGKSKLAVKDLTTGLRAINAEIASDPNPINYFERAKIYYKLGDVDKAEDDAIKACKGEFEHACNYCLRIRLDRSRERDWKLMNDYDFSAIYFKIIPQKSSNKYVWMRQEYYDKDTKKQLLSSLNGIVKNIDEVVLVTSGMKVDCSNSSVLTERFLFYSENELINTLETNNSTYQTIVPDTNIDSLYNQICKKTKNKMPN
jgi:tetratricopeptide (TPR) repeat protein